MVKESVLRWAAMLAGKSPLKQGLSSRVPACCLRDGQRMHLDVLPCSFALGYSHSKRLRIIRAFACADGSCPPVSRQPGAFRPLSSPVWQNSGFVSSESLKCLYGLPRCLGVQRWVRVQASRSWNSMPTTGPVHPGTPWPLHVLSELIGTISRGCATYPPSTCFMV